VPPLDMLCEDVGAFAAALFAPEPRPLLRLLCHAAYAADAFDPVCK
jgi:hypothetical protein